MTCLDVRDRLTEHALGLLGEEERREVDRHLEWCAGCRKESSHLQDGAAAVALGLPPARPPAALEERVVEAIAGPRAGPPNIRSAHRRLRPTRRAMRILAVATMAAVLAGMAGVAYGVRESNRAQTIHALALRRLQLVVRLNQLIKRLGGPTLFAQLLPTRGFQGLGSAVIATAPQTKSFVMVEAIPPIPDTGPYTVQLVDSRGKVYSLSQLKPTNNGDLIVLDYPTQNLSRVITVSVLDRFSQTVLTGKVVPYRKTP